jgi:hypothetical protein
MELEDVLGIAAMANRKSNTNTTSLASIAHLASVNVAENKVLALTDDGVYQNVTATAAITVPPNDTVAFPAGTQIPIFSNTADEVSIVAGDGVTIRYKTGLKIDGQYAGVTLYKLATNTWHLIGALKA